MPDVTFEEHIIVTLKLTQDEALWLRDYMQNPMETMNVSETSETKHHRESFFKALNVTIH